MSGSRGANLRIFIPDYMQEHMIAYYREEEATALAARAGRRSMTGVVAESRRLEQQEHALQITRGALAFTALSQPPQSLRRGIMGTSSVSGVSESDLETSRRVLGQLLGMEVAPSEAGETSGAVESAAPSVAPPAPPQSPIEVWRDLGRYIKLVLPPRPGSLPSELSELAYHNAMESIDRFARDEFNRAPVQDGATELMKVISHVSDVQNNCCWVPEEKAVFMGEWDTRFINPPNCEDGNYDVMTHEFGHAVTTYSADFDYIGQSGALNESISDVFAMMRKHRQANVHADSPEADWLVARNLLKYRDGSTASLRSMMNPGHAFRNHPLFGSDEQIGHTQHMDPRRWLEDKDHDWGGVHIYSGIPNRAFYLAAHDIGGGSWERCGQIWIKALFSARNDDDFAEFATRTITEAKNYNEGIEHAVQKAWSDVGVNPRVVRRRHR